MTLLQVLCQRGFRTAQWLAEHDILLAEGEIYLRRVIFAEGRSKST